MRTVKALAELAGVTVRTLHHYDQIGLLIPSARTDAGYRLYDHGDLLRLQQIMVWRQLGFGLGDILALLDDPDYDMAAALVAQRAELVARVEEMGLVLKRLDEALAEVQGGNPVEEEHMFEGFDNPEYAREAEERWGDTEAWRQSQERARYWTEEDKRRLVQDGIAHTTHLAAVFTAGVPADSEQAMDLAEEARLAIDREFYDCSKEMHVNLAEMYVEDPRFTAYYDQHAEGLAVWFRDAIKANARR
ncbi:MAG TPA: MerR family transcriptional regulator [Euzebya sp.]|nr:MerR family transcriptional regulator [Euzebya sp.]